MDRQVRHALSKLDETNLTRRRLLQTALAAGAISMSTFLAACGDDDDDDDSSTDGDSSGESASSGDGGGPVTVAFEGWDYEPPLVEENIARFEELNPNITVEYTPINGAQYRQKVVAEFTSGVEPDALYVRDDYFAGWVTAGYLQPIEGMPGLDEVYDRLYEYNAGAMTYDGERYGLPYYTDCQTFAYNAEMLEQAGFSAPPTTLDELTEQCLKLKGDGIVEFPLSYGFKLTNDFWGQWWGMIYASGAQLFDDDLNPIMHTDNTIAAEVLTWIKSGLEAGIIDPAITELDGDQTRDAFMAGQYAFQPTSRYDVELMNSPDQSQVAGKIKVALFPSLTGESLGTVGWNRQYCITSSTDAKDAAYDLIYYLGGLDENGDPYTARFWFLQRGLGFAFKDLDQDPEIRAKLEEFIDPDIYFKQAEIARPREAINEPWYSEWDSASQESIQRALIDQISVDDAMKEIADAAERFKEQLG